MNPSILDETSPRSRARGWQRPTARTLLSAVGLSLAVAVFTVGRAQAGDDPMALGALSDPTQTSYVNEALSFLGLASTIWLGLY